MDSILDQVQKLIEFYFSDGNLTNSSFLRTEMAKSDNQSVKLDVLITFNKLKSLTVDREIIRKAIKGSHLVALTTDKNSIFRVTPLQELEPIIDRSIYVANISADSNHDTIRELFMKYGEVLYVSIPRYLSTNDVRGFAFVDFATSESVKLALKQLRPKKKDNRKLAVWRYISRNNTQTRDLEMSARKWNIDLKKIEDPIMNLLKNKAEQMPLSALSKQSWQKYQRIFRSWQRKRNELIREKIQTAQTAFYTKSYFHNSEETEPAESVSSPYCEAGVRESPNDDGYETQVSSASHVSAPTASFTPGLILHLVCKDSVHLSRKKVRSIIEPVINQIAYIDVIEGASESFLRTISPEASSQVLNELHLDSSGGHLQLLHGEDEARYWDRVQISQSKKRASNNSKRKKRLAKKRKCDEIPDS